MSAATLTPLAAPPAAPAATPAAVPPAGPPLYLDRLYRFTVDQCRAMLTAGILEERRGVELLDGLLVVAVSKNDAHVKTLNRTRKRLDRVLPAGWDSHIQDPITLDSGNEPEPDYVIFRGSDADYPGRHPGPADVGLVVEVADTSLASDRRDKARLYAAAGIGVYWVVNTVDRQVEVYTAPQPTAEVPHYAARTDYKPGQDVPLTLDGATVAVPAAELLP